MPQILAWECPKTGALFKEKSDYIAHLKAYAKQQLLDRAHKRYVSGKEAFFRQMREQVEDFDQLKQFIFDNWEHFCRNAHDRDTWYNRDISFDFSKWAKPKAIHLDLRWSDRVSNSHNCPGNGVTNWHGSPDLPKGYPGWYGRIEIKWESNTSINRLKSCLGSSYFDKSGIHTGSGSGTDLGFSQGLEIFYEDWPGLAKTRDLEQVTLRMFADGSKVPEEFKPTV
jgi:hypothetical protein